MKDFLTNKKLLILVGLFILVLVVTIVVTMFSKKPIPNGEPKPTGGVVPTVPAGKSTPIEPNDETGVNPIGNDLPPDEQKIVNTTFDLKKKLPLENESFLLDYDYVEGKFLIFLKSPVDSSADAFAKFLKDNGYDIIPQDQFIPGSYR